MTLLHAAMQRREAAVAGRLVKYRIALCGGGEGLRVAVLLPFDSGKTGAQHEDELVAQHLACGTQFAVIAMTFAQQASLAISAAIAETREHQGDHGEPVKIREEMVDIPVIGPDPAGLSGAAEQSLGVFEKPCRRNQDRAIARQLRAVGDMHENIGGYSSLLNEGHSPAPRKVRHRAASPHR